MATLREIISKLERLYTQYGDLSVYIYDFYEETEIDIDNNIERQREIYFCGEYLGPERILIG